MRKTRIAGRLNHWTARDALVAYALWFRPAPSLHNLILDRWFAGKVETNA